MKPVAHYIPHQPPMRLIGELVRHGDDGTVVTAQVASDNVFFDPVARGVPAWTGIEYLAQTAAVWVGLHCEQLGRPIQPAFLISSRQYTATVPLFAEGEQLEVEVRADLVEPPIVVFSGSIRRRTGETLAEGIFSAYQPEDVTAFLRESEPVGVGRPTSDV